MSDLVKWLRVQLDEDERIAWEALVGTPLPRPPTSPAQWAARYHRVVQRERSGGIGPDVLLVADCGPANVYPAKHIARWAPARVLAEVGAKRRLVDLAVALVETETTEPSANLLMRQSSEIILERLALPYADRSGYDEAWRPGS